ncbi:hypothetical protein H1R20_g3153, partial [Candolleomyces eurysporus]
MNEVIPGLWIGDLRSALDTQSLKANQIQSVLSAMRGVVRVHETFIRHQVALDDVQDADVLAHFEACNQFIGAQLSKGRGVLVHCLAGISRSATVVAAYLMYSKKLSPTEAVDLIRLARPFVSPNPGFLNQLEVYHEAGCVVSTDSTDVRRFYLDRTVVKMQDEQTTLEERTQLVDSLPSVPSSSATTTTIGVSTGGMPTRRRLIRCKMCRQELATKEHMLGHGEVGFFPPTPGSPPADPTETAISVPILINPLCSGYFVEPLKWMNEFLKKGEVSGKILCPNKRCKAKLGNYDWAGVGCGCGQWATPAFCLNRSKVDEIVV